MERVREVGIDDVANEDDHYLLAEVLRAGADDVDAGLAERLDDSLEAVGRAFEVDLHGDVSAGSQAPSFVEDGKQVTAVVGDGLERGQKLSGLVDEFEPNRVRFRHLAAPVGLGVAPAVEVLCAHRPTPVGRPDAVVRDARFGRGFASSRQESRDVPLRIRIRDSATRYKPS